METYSCHLNKEYFELIKSRKKKIELRLFDEKRKQYKIGDKILFINREDENERVLTQIKRLHKYKNFKELFDNINISMFGYESESEFGVKTMEEFYPSKEQEKYGVVGIEIQLIKD